MWFTRIFSRQGGKVSRIGDRISHNCEPYPLQQTFECLFRCYIYFIFNLLHINNTKNNKVVHYCQAFSQKLKSGRPEDISHHKFLKGKVQFS